MIHYVDSEKEWEQMQHSDYLGYVTELKNSGVIRHIGMSSHNPKVARKAAESGYVEMILFSINPAFDMLPASENIDTMFAETFNAGLKGTDPDRAKLYRICEENDVGIKVMKGFAGGRLFDEKRSPFGVRLSPVQCIHYALTRPAVSAILCGYDTRVYLKTALGCAKCRKRRRSQRPYRPKRPQPAPHGGKPVHRQRHGRRHGCRTLRTQPAIDHAGYLHPRVR